MTTAIKPLMTGGSDLPQTIVYKYDLLNRIAGAEHLNAQIDAQNKFLQGITDDKYKTAYTYDQNGNITSLKRHDQNGLIFDDFTYHYLNDIDAPNSPTNRLGYVGDIVTDSLKNFDIDNQNIDNYVYNKIGQLVKDKAENIDTIIWNNQAKIKEIIQSDNDPDLEFRYDPMGNRIAKIVKPKNSSGYVLGEPNWIYTYYVRDAQGNVMGVYKRDTLLDFSTVYQARFTIEEHHLYGSDRLGIEKPSDNLLAEVLVNWDGNYLSAVDSTNSIFHKDPNYYQLIIGDKNYEMKNHLGNVLAVVRDRKLLKTPLNGSFNGFEPDIVSFSDYYPFGMAMGGRFGSVGSYRFGFGSHEKDDEIAGSGNHLSFGDYGYSPRLGRRWNIDPVEIVGMSGYATFRNNPNFWKDPDGESPISIFAKAVAKAGLKKAAKETVEKMIKKRLSAYMSKGWAKQLGKDALDAIDLATSTAWWEYAIEFIPIAGDVYGAAKLGEQGYAVYKITQKFESVGKWASTAAGKAFRKLGPNKVTGKGSDLVSSFTKKFNNQADHLTESDLAGAVKEIYGLKSGVKASGKPHQHLKEVQDALGGMKTQINSLKKQISDGAFEGDALKAAQGVLNDVSKQYNEINNTLNSAKKAAKQF